MAAGLPIIATAVDGTKQAMVHAETGWLVAPRSVSELEQALIELLTDQRRARAMGTAAQRRVSALFGTEPYVAKHLALYCR
jgi:type III pantothenate kinase